MEEIGEVMNLMRKESIENFEQAVDYLYNMPRFTSKNTMEDTKAFLHALGDPDREMRIIHVAGTNGKGSVCAYLRSMLEAAGKSVAVFTSPHLVDIRERFVIRGQMVSKEAFLEAFGNIYERLDWKALEQGEGYHPTFFEYLFFMAMVLFRQEQTDYVILETGLGGRLDATNSIGTKELAVITRIGLDHVEYLGDTLEAIAGEKAGIFCADAPAVYLASEETVGRVFREKAEKLGITAYPVSKNDYTFLGILNNKNIDFSLQCKYYGYVRFSVNTIAAYQAENVALAVRALEVLDKEHQITLEQVRTGLEQCVWQGRMEEVLPEIYLDGAHNEDGIRAFLDTVKNDGYNGRRRLLFGVVEDKDYPHMLQRLIESGFFVSIGIARLQTGRAASLEKIDKIMKRYPGCAYTYYKNVDAALHELLTHRAEGERLYIAGSLYLVGEVKSLLVSHGIKELVNHDKF